MEPDGLGSVLWAVLAALGGFAEPDATEVRINGDAPAEVRPLRFSGQGRLIDVHPSQIADLRLETDLSGMPALTVRFGPEVTSWIAATTSIGVGQPMPVHLCGEVWMVPYVREPILAGNVMLSGDLSRDELLAAMQIIAGRVGCDGQPVGGGLATRRPNARGAAGVPDGTDMDGGRRLGDRRLQYRGRCR